VVAGEEDDQHHRIGDIVETVGSAIGRGQAEGRGVGADGEGEWHGGIQYDECDGQEVAGNFADADGKGSAPMHRRTWLSAAWPPWPAG
jgi:hypothetical protein